VFYFFRVHLKPLKNSGVRIQKSEYIILDPDSCLLNSVLLQCFNHCNDLFISITIQLNRF
jgi:hypothetical protein